MILRGSLFPLFGPSSFRYQSIWKSHHYFIPVMKEPWILPALGCPLAAFFVKLKRLKGVLKTWDSQVFKNIFGRVRVTEEALILAETSYDADPSSLLKAQWVQAQLAFNSELSIENAFLRQKAKIK